MFNQLKHNPKTTAHTGGKSAIFLKAVLIVPPNFKIKTNDNSKNMHNVAISQKIALKKAIRIKNAKGSLTFYKVKGNKKIKINKKTGKLRVKKGLRKGTYKVKVRVNAAGNENYKAASRTVTFKIKVK